MYVYASVFEIFYVGPKIVIMDIKIEFTRSKNLGLDIKYTPFELV